MAITISCASIKGGVSKTTTTINLAAAMAEQQYRCLVVDFDPQANASLALGIPEDVEYNIADVLMPLKNNQSVPIEKVILQTKIPNLDVAPAGMTLTLGRMMLNNVVARESVLRKELMKKSIQERYEFIFIDTAPSVDILLLNALAASDYVVGVSTCEYFSLKGIDMMLDSYNEIKDNGINEQLKFMGVIATKNNKTNHAKDTLKTLRSRYNLIGVTPTSTKANEATENGVPVILYDKNNKVSQEYQKIAKMLMTKYETDEF